MKFAHFFIDRPIFAGVISIIITLMGAIAMTVLILHNIRTSRRRRFR